MVNEANPLVTFILFAYNQAPYIREAVDSALAQDYPNLEVIISDDCSSDTTYSVMEDCVREYSGPHRVTVRKNQKNIGMVGHMNCLLALAKGEFVCWAAGDDVSLPQKVSKLVAPMVADAAFSGAHSYVTEMSSEGRILGIRRPRVPDIIQSPQEVIRQNIEIISQSHAFRKSAWDMFGPISDAVTNDGVVMAFREAMAGQIILIPEALTKYRLGVGVSTQRGKTIEELAVTEPAKYANWWATGFAQVARDARHVGVSTSLLAEIHYKLKYFQARHRINEQPWAIGVLFQRAFQPGFVPLLKAFTRRNMPRPILRWFYTSKGWL